MHNETIQPGRIIKGLLLSLVAAGLVTLLFILPAEFGKDPTGVGSLLGLTRLGAKPAIVQRSLPMEGEFPAVVMNFDEYEPPLIGLPFASSHDAPFSSKTFSISLQPGEQVEYKAVMEQGDMLLYSWTSDAAEVYCDFHGDPATRDGYPKGYFVRYAESETPAAQGSIVAPFDGNHGWYWLNYNEEAITIELSVSEQYSRVDELGRSFQY